MGGFSQYTQPEESPRWRPFAIAGAIILLVVAVIYAVGRGGGTHEPAPLALPVYASNLQIGDLHLSTSENFVGGRVTYLEGKVGNLGDKTVIGAQLEIVFRNTLGEIVDKQTQPMRVEAAPLGHTDWVSLTTAPLGPGKAAAFRLTFDHISSDWNQGYPEMRFVSVQTK